MIHVSTSTAEYIPSSLECGVVAKILQIGLLHLLLNFLVEVVFSRLVSKVPKHHRIIVLHSFGLLFPPQVVRYGTKPHLQSHW